MLTAAVQAKQVDAVLVKDLSRLGRHRTQTALFIDFLRQQQVRVISATEGVDTFCEEDDLMIGVRGLMNDYYAKDIGKKIRAGYRQKQQEGLVITPPFGYWKDRNTNQVLVYPEAAETVQLIYALYLQGCGQKEITRWLNTEGRKTPAQLRAEWCGKEVRHTHKTRDGQFLWTYASVKNILVEEAYSGVLNNHRREYNNGKGEPMNNDTSNRSTPATASPLTVKEAAPPVMIKKIGKTTYRVKIHFSETSKETMSDKIKRLILNDSEKSS